MTASERKVAIIGKSRSTMMDAPYDDDTWEIWTLHDMVQIGEVPRYTRHFELHPLRWFKDENTEYYQWLCAAHDRPIYLRKDSDEVSAGRAYPMDTIVERFGRYFTNTISWMIALAIQEEVSEIGLWGVDMAQDTEYASQRPSCEYFLGLAVGAGITVQIPTASDMLKSRVLYGFETDSGDMRQKLNAMNKQMQQQLKGFREQRNQSALNAAYCEGALEALRYWNQWQ